VVLFVNFNVLLRIGTPLYLGFLLASGLLALMPNRAFAGGLEVTSYGARALGRGGAVMAATEGADALRYNPGRLAASRKWTIGLDGQLHIGDTCFTRTDVATGTELPEVCNQRGPGYIPQLAASIPIGRKHGLGLGVLFPAGTSALRFGRDSDGTVAQGGTRIPSPARYSMISSENLAVFPTIGFGTNYGRLRLGASFGWGVFVLKNVNFSSGLPSQNELFDARSALSASDSFVPRLMVAGDYDITKRLRLAFQATWTAAVNASGSVFLSGVTNGMPYSTRIDGATVNSPNPWEAGLGTRYQGKEWDIEFDFLYLGSSALQEVVIRLPDSARLPVAGTIDGKDISRLNSRQAIQRHWQDQLIFRVGSEFRILKSRVALRSGLSYETSGVEHGYEAVDNLPLSRFGVHAGLGVQMTSYAELNLAFAALFIPEAKVSASEARLEQITGQRPLDLANERVLINAGSFRTGLQAVALSVLFRGR